MFVDPVAKSNGSADAVLLLPRAISKKPQGWPTVARWRAAIVVFMVLCAVSIGCAGSWAVALQKAQLQSVASASVTEEAGALHLSLQGVAAVPSGWVGPLGAELCNLRISVASLGSAVATSADSCISIGAATTPADIALKLSPQGGAAAALADALQGNFPESLTVELSGTARVSIGSIRNVFETSVGFSWDVSVPSPAAWQQHAAGSGAAATGAAQLVQALAGVIAGSGAADASGRRRAAAADETGAQPSDGGDWSTVTVPVPSAIALPLPFTLGRLSVSLLGAAFTVDLRRDGAGGSSAPIAAIVLPPVAFSLTTDGKTLDGASGASAVSLHLTTAPNQLSAAAASSSGDGNSPGDDADVASQAPGALDGVVQAVSGHLLRSAVKRTVQRLTAAGALSTEEPSSASSSADDIGGVSAELSSLDFELVLSARLLSDGFSSPAAAGAGDAAALAAQLRRAFTSSARSGSSDASLVMSLASAAANAVFAQPMALSGVKDAADEAGTGRGHQLASIPVRFHVGGEGSQLPQSAHSAGRRAAAAASPYSSLMNASAFLPSGIAIAITGPDLTVSGPRLSAQLAVNMSMSGPAAALVSPLRRRLLDSVGLSLNYALSMETRIPRAWVPVRLSGSGDATRFSVAGCSLAGGSAPAAAYTCDTPAMAAADRIRSSSLVSRTDCGGVSLSISGVGVGGVSLQASLAGEGVAGCVAHAAAEYGISNQWPDDRAGVDGDAWLLVPSLVDAQSYFGSFAQAVQAGQTNPGGTVHLVLSNVGRLVFPLATSVRTWLLPAVSSIAASSHFVVAMLPKMRPHWSFFAWDALLTLVGDDYSDYVSLAAAALGTTTSHYAVAAAASDYIYAGLSEDFLRWLQQAYANPEAAIAAKQIEYSALPGLDGSVTAKSRARLAIAAAQAISDGGAAGVQSLRLSGPCFPVNGAVSYNADVWSTGTTLKTSYGCGTFAASWNWGRGATTPFDGSLPVSAIRATYVDGARGFLVSQSMIPPRLHGVGAATLRAAKDTPPPVWGGSTTWPSDTLTSTTSSSFEVRQLVLRGAEILLPRAWVEEQEGTAMAFSDYNGAWEARLPVTLPSTWAVPFALSGGGYEVPFGQALSMYAGDSRPGVSTPLQAYVRGRRDFSLRLAASLGLDILSFFVDAVLDNAAGLPVSRLSELFTNPLRSAKSIVGSIYPPTRELTWLRSDIQYAIEGVAKFIDDVTREAAGSASIAAASIRAVLAKDGACFLDVGASALNSQAEANDWTSANCGQSSDAWRNALSALGDWAVDFAAAEPKPISQLQAMVRSNIDGGEMEARIDVGLLLAMFQGWLQNNDGGMSGIYAPTPSPTAMATPSPSASRSVSPSGSPTSGLSISPSPSTSVSMSVSPTKFLSPSASPSVSATTSVSPSVSASASVSPTQFLSPSASPSVSPSPSASPSVSPSSGMVDATVTGVPNPDVTATNSPSPSTSKSVAALPSVSGSQPASESPIPPGISRSRTPAASASGTAAATATLSSGASPSTTTTSTRSNTATGTQTLSPGSSPTGTPSSTAAPSLPSGTPTQTKSTGATVSSTMTMTRSATGTRTGTRSASGSPAAGISPSGTATASTSYAPPPPARIDSTMRLNGVAFATLTTPAGNEIMAALLQFMACVAASQPLANGVASLNAAIGTLSGQPVTLAISLSAPSSACLRNVTASSGQRLLAAAAAPQAQARLRGHAAAAGGGTASTELTSQESYQGRALQMDSDFVDLNVSIALTIPPASAGSLTVPAVDQRNQAAQAVAGQLALMGSDPGNVGALQPVIADSLVVALQQLQNTGAVAAGAGLVPRNILTTLPAVAAAAPAASTGATAAPASDNTSVIVGGAAGGAFGLLILVAIFVGIKSRRAAERKRLALQRYQSKSGRKLAAASGGSPRTRSGRLAPGGTSPAGGLGDSPSKRIRMPTGASARGLPTAGGEGGAFVSNNPLRGGQPGAPAAAAWNSVSPRATSSAAITRAGSSRRGFGSMSEGAGGSGSPGGRAGFEPATAASATGPLGATAGLVRPRVSISRPGTPGSTRFPTAGSNATPRSLSSSGRSAPGSAAGSVASPAQRNNALLAAYATARVRAARAATGTSMPVSPSGRRLDGASPASDGGVSPALSDRSLVAASVAASKMRQAVAARKSARAASASAPVSPVASVGTGSPGTPGAAKKRLAALLRSAQELEAASAPPRSPPPGASSRSVSPSGKRGAPKMAHVMMGALAASRAGHSGLRSPAAAAVEVAPDAGGGSEWAYDAASDRYYDPVSGYFYRSDTDSWYFDYDNPPPGFTVTAGAGDAAAAGDADADAAAGAALRAALARARAGSASPGAGGGRSPRLRQAVRGVIAQSATQQRDAARASPRAAAAAASAGEYYGYDQPAGASYDYNQGYEQSYEQTQAQGYDYSYSGDRDGAVAAGADYSGYDYSQGGYAAEASAPVTRGRSMRTASASLRSPSASLRSTSSSLRSPSSSLRSPSRR